MEITRTSVAQGLSKNINDTAKLVGIINAAGAQGEAHAVKGKYVELIAKGLGFQTPEVVQAVACALANMGSAGAVYIPEIGGRLVDENAEMRAAILEGLGRFGYEAHEFASKAARMSIDEEQDFVKAAAISMLGNVGAEEEAEIIIDALGSKNEAVSCAACEALGMLGLMGDRGEVLSKMLQKPSTRWSALTAMASMGYHAPVEALGAVISAGLTHDDSTYRDQAVAVVGNLTEAAAQEPYLGSLKALLSNSSPGARASAAMALGTMGVAAAAQADDLVPLFSDEGEESAGPQIAQVMGTSAKRASPCSRLPKAAAAYAVGQMKAVQHLDKIGACMHDKNWEVRLVALDAASEMGPSAILLADTIAPLCQDAAFPVRAGAASALGQIASEGHIGDVAAALEDQSHSVRLAAVLALADFGEKAWPHSHEVFKLLQDPMNPVRAGAVRCLSLMGDTGCNYAGVLATLLNQPDAELRAEIIDALGRMGNFGSSFAEEVADCLYDNNALVSDAAMRALLAMGPAGATLLKDTGVLGGVQQVKQLTLPERNASQKGYVSALERERAKLGI